jgi:hypothetical protein
MQLPLLLAFAIGTASAFAPAGFLSTPSLRNVAAKSSVNSPCSLALTLCWIVILRMLWIFRAGKAGAAHQHMVHGGAQAYHCGQLEDESGDRGGGGAACEGNCGGSQNFKGSGYA